MNLTNNTRTFTKEEALNLRELNGKVAVSSLWIAEQANNNHYDLMKKIKKMFKNINRADEVLIESVTKSNEGNISSVKSVTKSNELNFQSVKNVTKQSFVYYYKDSKGELRPFYIFPELEANFVIASFNDIYRYKLMQELHNYRENKYAKQLQDLESEKRIALMDLQMYEIKERIQKNHEKHVIDVVRKLTEDGLNYDPTTLATNLDYRLV